MRLSNKLKGLHQGIGGDIELGDAALRVLGPLFTFQCVGELSFERNTTSKQGKRHGRVYHMKNVHIDASPSNEGPTPLLFGGKGTFYR